MRQVSKIVVVAIAGLLAAGCSMSKKPAPAAAGTEKGVAGQYYFVNLFSAPIGGVITSDIGGIDCGASGVAVNNAVTPPQYVPAYYPSGSGSSNKCGQTRFLWAQTVVLTATPRNGNAFVSWAGDCQGTGPCTLAAGSDKTVVAIFGPPGGGHANLTDPTLHGPAYFSFRVAALGALQCTSCHGATLAGKGIAPNCNDCHVTAGFPDWQNNCTFCHASPPAAPHAQSNDCGGCHEGYSKTGPTTGTVGPYHLRPPPIIVPPPACTSCHGTAGVNAAPPADVLGRTATTLKSVGAHQAHVASTLMGPMACTECHGAASATYATGHSDGTVQVGFGPLANHGTTTLWNGASCAASYCHGGTNALAGGTATTPVWTTVDGSQKGCASCHGFPPPLPHEQRDDCSTCHAGYAKTTATTGTVVVATHINGAIDVAVPYTCTSCHGTAGVNNAPPRDTTGGTATTLLGVGAHQAHVAATLSAPIACSECHGAASASYTTSHRDNTVQVAFGTLSGAPTQWNRASASCAASYCHGGTTALKGGTATTPVWTTVDGTQKGCASCHGNPPPAPHVQRADCATCHPGYTSSTVAAATHVNGTVEVSALTCTSCHGNPPTTPHVMQSDCGTCHLGYTNSTVNAATHYDGVVDVITMTCTTCHGDPARSGGSTLAAMPPKAVSGATLATERGVGAHLAHLNPGPLSNGVACTDCHNPPTSPLHTSGAVEFSWSPLAKGAGTPAFNPTDASCATVYCHGNFVGGNTLNAPIWTAAGTGAACGSCHMLPPPAPHTQLTACATCHGVGYSLTTVNPATHVNGVVEQVTTSCTSCHGTTGVNPAPPADTTGHVATTARGVGAHQAHVASTLMAPIACTQCHGAASATYTTGHSNGTVQMAFGALSDQGTTTLWNGASCAASYCHGGSSALTGGTATAPVWTLVDGTQRSCGSCHGSPPPAPHSQNTACATCHGAGYSQTTVNAATHINGTVDTVALTCTTCHGTAGVNPAPPVDTAGHTATTFRGVGAHQTHLATQLLANPLACTDCHGAASASYGTGHSNGSVQMAFSPLASTGLTPSWSGATCSVYCHGATAAVSGGTNTAPAWTVVNGTQATCATCHGFPPASPHAMRDDCGTCHPGYGTKSGTTATVNKATHLNGAVDTVTLTCTTCHGDSAQSATPAAPLFAAPPVDTTGATVITSAGVGAHQKHVAGTGSKPVACSECHGSLAAYTFLHSDGATPITFGTLGNASGAAWNAGSLTCASTYCHGNFTGGAAATSPVWTTTGALTCNSCHTSPPTLRHVNRADCGTCHPGYTNSTTNPATHVDGVVNVDPSLTCTTCHTYAMGSNTASYHHVMGADVSYSNPVYPANNSPATTSLSDKTCTMCHVGHGLFAAPGKVMRTSITGAVTAAANDEALCRSCHDQDQQKDQTRQKNDGTLATNGWAATVGAGWASGSGQGSHNYAVAGSFQASSAAAGAFTVNCVKCHNSGSATLYQNGTRTFSIHENVDRSLRSSLGQTTPADANEETFCYRCHSLTTDAIGGTVKSSSTLDWYNQQPLPTSSAGLYVQMQKTGGKHNAAAYSGKHRPNPAEENLAYIAANKHVECSDCHDPHQARRGSASIWGTVTSVAATTLTDSTVSWIPGQWVGYSVTVGTTTASTTWVRGMITANTATSLTYQTLSTTPSGLVKYRIGVRSSAGAVSSATATSITDGQSAVGGAKAWATNAWAGWNLNIVYGVGIGQSYPIASNTATQLTIAGTFATTPTTASRYTITRLPNTMDGATGVKVTAWGTGAPAWGAANTVSPAANSTTPIPEATSQNQVCFKCHSSANASLATWSATWTDQVKEFNPNNQSYHPIVAPSVTTSGTGVGNTALTAAQLTPSATTMNAGGMAWSPGDMMTCSDCHGNDTVTAAASQGPHASAVAFILKGPNTRWPTQSNGTTRWTYSNRTTGEGTSAGLFCLNCHTLNSVHQSNHTSYACTACHIRIPHGGKVRRLIVTFANTLSAQGLITTGTPAPYVDTGVTQILRAATGGTSSSNCNAGCSGGTSTRSGHTLTVSATNSW